MRSTVLITGASGMLARHLAGELEAEYELRFLSRRPKEENEFRWDIREGYLDPEALRGVDHVIHLAGASVAGGRWTPAQRQRITESRAGGARLIREGLRLHEIKLRTYISASAIGYYGTETSSHIHTEADPPGSDFLADVCRDWEKEAELFGARGLAGRTVILRIGVILSRGDGLLKRLSDPMRFGLAAFLGHGRQYVPWIHIADLSAMISFVLRNKKPEGIFNAVAPRHVTNRELTRGVAAKLGQRTLLAPVPGLVLRTLYGEMSSILLKGSRISSDRIEKAGFAFTFGNIDKALEDLL